VGNERLLLAIGAPEAIEAISRAVAEVNGRRARFPDWLQPSAAANLSLAAPTGRTPLGFALAMRHDPTTWAVEELFIVAGARRHGIGARAVHGLFALHPGAWTLTVRPENPAALAFWRAAAPGATEHVELGADGVVRTRLWIAGATTGVPG